uniref:Uncharacterized protein n=1 Tax=Picea glauca TaxID=3330 RepID=A0A117NHJ5_PICGL|nr:hypothetical protein ABT39_MTgene4440 [Picea glauca]QHR88835.1 hypothetical protein Q903MT_gene2854 [Picea sitchensis]
MSRFLKAFQSSHSRSTDITVERPRPDMYGWLVSTKVSKGEPAPSLGLGSYLIMGSKLIRLPTPKNRSCLRYLKPGLAFRRTERKEHVAACFHKVNPLAVHCT